MATGWGSWLVLVIAIALSGALLVALVYEDPVYSLAGLAALACIAVVYFLIGLRPRAQLA